MTQDIEAIIERLEKAEGPDRELDCFIWCLANGKAPVYINDILNAQYYEKDTLIREPLGHRKDGPFVARECLGEPAPPKYTASQDAAIALCKELLPGRMWEVRGWPTGAIAKVFSEANGCWWEERHKSEPIALLIAMCRAYLAKEKT